MKKVHHSQNSKTLNHSFFKIHSEGLQKSELAGQRLLLEMARGLESLEIDGEPSWSSSDKVVMPSSIPFSSHLEEKSDAASLIF